ncbi:hypothetical protein HGRIS_007756 [Hohenbuehelia grisea]|uniref:Uncharacterized protein n=1 Tax=Hohenbuehelia grisea TaxID=104357 RepID=A0ABR3J6A9_9AGAR
MTNVSSFSLSEITRRSLSGDDALESILSDIPFFSVGLLAFGTFTFLLAMKRINLLSTYLYLSALFGFAAAILDLSQILACSKAKDPQSPPNVSGIITTRELALAVSVGFRYLFYWLFVATCPRGESPTPQGLPPPLTARERRDSRHSAAWERWGLQGIALKYILLLLVGLVPIFQIVWRVNAPSRRYGTLYVAEAALEVVLTALLILKLLLNAFLSPRRPIWVPLLAYAAPLFALGLSAAVAIGNASSFLYSEKVLGRFLQALELYVLIVYLLIDFFYKRDTGTTLIIHPQPMNEKAPPTTPFSVKSPLADLPPLPPPPIAKDPEPGSRPSKDTGRRSSKTHSRASSWKASRRSSRRRVSGEQRLWDQNKAELGLGDEDITESPRASPEPTSPRVEEARAEPTNLTSQTQDLGKSSAADVPSQEPPRLRPPLNQFPVNPRGDFFQGPRRPRVGSSSIPSYYLNDGPSPVVVSRPLPNPSGETGGTDTPVYGLDSTTYLPKQRLSVEVSLSTGSFGELMRQQTELEKSIAALRLFSPSSSESELPRPASGTSQQTRKETPENDSLTDSARKAASVSAFSEFSLSIFPDPPDDSVPVPVSPTPRSRPATMRAQRLARARSVLTSAVQPLTIPIDEYPSDESFSRVRGNTTPSYDSAATQYDVTSFIGDLMGPSTGMQSASAVGSSATLTELPPTGAMPAPVRPKSMASTDISRPNLKPLILAGTLGPSPLSQAASPSSTRAQPPNSATIFTANTRRTRNGLPPRPRLTTIIGPRPLQDGRGDPGPDAFERTRPAPKVPGSEVDKLGPNVNGQEPVSTVPF